MSDILNLTITLLKSTGNYTYYRIEGSTKREAYEKAMRRCIELVSNQDLDIIEQSITEYANTSTLLYPKRFLFVREEIHYHELACDQALDVVRSIKERFITGGSRVFPVRGGIVYEDKSIF